MKKKVNPVYKKSHYNSGINAEKLAADMLLGLGYKILQQRLRTPFGEIDILCAHNNTLIAVEVKKRKTHDLAGQSITARQQTRIMEGLLFFQAEHETYHTFDLRLDAVLVDDAGNTQHIDNAWGA